MGRSLSEGMRKRVFRGGLACLAVATAAHAANAAETNVNLVTNPSFEDVDPNPDNGSIFGSLAVFDWDGDRNFSYAYSQGYTGAAPPGAGNRYWYGGGNDGGSINQTIDVSSGSAAAAIATGNAAYDLSAYFGSYRSQQDYGTIVARFLGDGDVELDSATIGGEQFTLDLPFEGIERGWAQDATSGPVPMGTRLIELTLSGALGSGGSAGQAADGYADLVSLVITPEPGSMALLALSGLALLRRKRE